MTNKYLTLYRKWRPDNTKDFVGQDNVITALQNQITNNKIGNSYLFCGTRGTGKTSTAKWFAKAINCEHPINGNPCGKCKSCLSIDNNTNLDVVEIDAASNNGVDDIRKLKETVKYPPLGKFKVYIIDECHMLSVAANNAFLKTIEEPPSYVVFIFATTNPDKVLPTIISRCQRYDFKRILDDILIQRMDYICGQEKVEVEEDAFRLVAKKANGSMRDALSLLERIITANTGKITHTMAMSTLGIVEDELMYSMIDNIANNNVVELLDNFTQIYQSGKDIVAFVEQLISCYRNILIAKITKDTSSLIDMSEHNRESVISLTALMNEAQITEIIKEMSKVYSDAKNSTDPKTIIELGLLKVTEPLISPDISTLVVEIKKLQDEVKRLQGGVNSKQETLQTAPKENSALSNIAKFLEVKGFDDLAKETLKIDTFSLNENEAIIGCKNEIKEFLMKQSTKCQAKNKSILERAIEVNYSRKLKVVFQQ